MTIDQAFVGTRNDVLPVSSVSIPTMPVLIDFNTGINTTQICGVIPVFGIPVLEALHMTHDAGHQSDRQTRWQSD